MNKIRDFSRSSSGESCFVGWNVLGASVQLERIELDGENFKEKYNLNNFLSV